MSKRLKIILVANSVPLPESDFLRHKLFGLSKKFDVSYLCWGSNEDEEKFYNKYSDKVEEKNIHLFYDKWSTATLIQLIFKNAGRFLFSPVKSISLFNKLVKEYGWNYKKLFLKFSEYFPILKLNPDVVHFEFGTLAYRFNDIKKFVDCKVSVSFRGYDINYVGLEDDEYYSKVWQQFDGFHFLGNDLKNRAVKRGYTSGKIEALIPPAIDTNFFQPVTQKKTEEKLKIISVGRLVWKKGYEYALQAVAVLKQNNIPFEYHIVANGNHKQAILFTIHELGLTHEVKIISSSTTEEVKKMLLASDVFLHPAVSEGFSNAVLEAQAMGLPVITTDADGLAENVVDSETGFVVPVYDVQAMADKLRWCYDNKELLNAIGQKGIQRVQAHFRIEDQIKKFEAFYKRVAGVE